MPQKYPDFIHFLGDWQLEGDAVGYCFFHLYIRIIPQMTNRVTYAPQDFQRMCKQAERDHESKKLTVLMERVKRQIAERDNPGMKTALHQNAITSDSSVLRLPSRSVPFER